MSMWLLFVFWSLVCAEVQCIMKALLEILKCVSSELQVSEQLTHSEDTLLWHFWLGSAENISLRLWQISGLIFVEVTLISLPPFFIQWANTRREEARPTVLTDLMLFTYPVKIHSILLIYGTTLEIYLWIKTISKVQLNQENLYLSMAVQQETQVTPQNSLLQTLSSPQHFFFLLGL